MIISGDLKMIVNSNEMLRNAKKGKYAIPAFNFVNLEFAKYILEKCEELKSPVILGVTEGAKIYMGGFLVATKMIEGLVKDLKITVPVCLHLDHGTSYESCVEAIDAGFNSVMIDASKYDLEENIRITKSVVDYAEQRNVSVEAEVGHIGGVEDNISAEVLYADVEETVELVTKSGVNTIAPGLGTSHGVYKGDPVLSFERMIEISSRVDSPLVMHGASGLSEELIKKSIENGISKINIDTDLKTAWADALRIYIGENERAYDARKIVGATEEAVKKIVAEKINLFGSANKAPNS